MSGRYARCRRWVACTTGIRALRKVGGRISSQDTYLEWRWAEGCRNGKRLWREIREQGFAHSYSAVARFVVRLRRAERAGQPTGATRRATPRPPTPRQVALLCLRRPEKRTPGQQAYLDQLQQADEAVASAYTLTQDFAAMLRERRGERLDAWLAEAEACPAPALRRFATGLRDNLDAVRAGLSERWSNGPTEGFSAQAEIAEAPGVRARQLRSLTAAYTLCRLKRERRKVARAGRPCEFARFTG